MIRRFQLANCLLNVGITLNLVIQAQVKTHVVFRPKEPRRALVIEVIRIGHERLQCAVDTNPLWKRVVAEEAEFRFEIFNRIAQHGDEHCVRIGNFFDLLRISELGKLTPWFQVHFEQPEMMAQHIVFAKNGIN